MCHYSDTKNTFWPYFFSIWICDFNSVFLFGIFHWVNVKWKKGSMLLIYLMTVAMLVVIKWFYSFEFHNNKKIRQWIACLRIKCLYFNSLNKKIVDEHVMWQDAPFASGKSFRACAMYDIFVHISRTPKIAKYHKDFVNASLTHFSVSIIPFMYTLCKRHCLSTRLQWML